jgi:hypothetical protein
MLASVVETAVNERPSIGGHIIPKPVAEGNSGGDPSRASRQIRATDTRRVQTAGVGDSAIPKQSSEMIRAVTGQRSGGAHGEEIVGPIAEQPVEIGQHLIAESTAINARTESHELIASSLPPRPQFVER